MGMNQTPASERVHIGFFGKRNAGKSSVMNKVTGQDLAVVSDIKGTTTDPVYKSMELLPLGTVVMMDTPGIDDEGELGSLRVKKSYQVLNKTDTAVLVIDGKAGISREDQDLLERIRKKNIPSILVLNKRDTLTEEEVCQTLSGLPEGYQEGKDFLWVSAREGTGIHELKERLAVLASTEENQKKIVGDLLSPGDLVVLVVPIDKAAPKGRLILPQQQAMGYPGRQCSVCSHKGRPDKGNSGQSGKEAKAGHYRQPGIWKSFQRHPQEIPLLHFLSCLPDIKEIWMCWPREPEPWKTERRG